ncbi:hypothetical protein H8356DRAFT_1322137, partial [Neocallimastix lanati (nom. inval.)]
MSFVNEKVSSILVVSPFSSQEAFKEYVIGKQQAIPTVGLRVLSFNIFTRELVTFGYISYSTDCNISNKHSEKKHTINILSNNTHTKAPVLNTQLDRPVGTLSAYMEMCDYFNIPTAPEGGELKPRMFPIHSTKIYHALNTSSMKKDM